MSVLCKIKDSKLAFMFSGKFNLEKNMDGSINIDEDPQVFKHVIGYLESDRTVLPPVEIAPDSKKPTGVRVEVEKKITEFGLDQALARPDVLTTKIAKDF